MDTAGQGGSWQPDPMGRYLYRWWDGVQWTSSVSDNGSDSLSDPLGMSPGPLPDSPPSTLERPTAGEADSSLVNPGFSAPPGQPSVVRPPPPPAFGSPAPAQGQYFPPAAQTPNFNLPGGGAWAAPQQVVVTNASKSPGLAISSLVLGVGAFFFSLLPLIGWASIPFAIVGLALGIAGVLRANKGFEGRGLSIAGIAGSLAALFVSAIYIFAVGAAVDDVPDVNSDPSDGVCDESRFFQDPDC
jgi:hypothetical protein